jgi:tetratricopeptide (TPR) repeat protein
VGEAFSRIDSTAQLVMQALAIYARPVTPVAVDYLLQPYLPGVDSAPVLSRLVNMHFTRKEEGRYYLHQVDRAYALSCVPRGEESDREEVDAPPLTQFALLHRGADYFEQARTPSESWKALEDLSPQLAEFDLRHAGGDYGTAANVLLEIDFDYLLLWGHYRLMVELHERLQDKLSDRELERRSVGNLGTAYRSMGQVQKAIICYGHALAIAREMENRQAEAAGLSGLGLCYATLGQTECALEHHQKSLDIDREIGSRQGEAIQLGNLGNCYADLGQTERAIEHYQKSLDIDREIGSRQGEAIQLGNLGICYAVLGQTERAIEHHQRVLDIAREIGNRQVEAIALGNLGDVLVEQGEWDESVQHYNEAIQIADEIGNVQVQNEARYSLAIARLYSGDLPAARDTAEAASQYDFPPNNHNVLALLSVIALRQDDQAAAQEAFAEAVSRADAMLSHSEQNYDVLDVKGLALCGLALCEENSDYIPTAIEAYRAARAINKDAGIVQRVLRLFDALAQTDSEGVLAKARMAAAGE